MAGEGAPALSPEINSMLKSFFYTGRSAAEPGDPFGGWIEYDIDVEMNCQRFLGKPLQGAGPSSPIIWPRFIWENHCGIRANRFACPEGPSGHPDTAPAAEIFAAEDRCTKKRI